MEVIQNNDNGREIEGGTDDDHDNNVHDDNDDDDDVDGDCDAEESVESKEGGCPLIGNPISFIDQQ